MLRNIKIYCLYFSSNIQGKMEYKLDFLLGNLASILGQIIGIAFVWVLFERIGDLNGWTLPEIMLIYGFAALPYGLFEVFLNGVWRLAYMIHMGTFDLCLTRPIRPLLLVVTEESATHGFGTFATGLVIVIAASRMLGIEWTAPLVLYAILAVVCGTVIYLSVNLITATCSFWFQGGRTSIMFMVQRLRDFANYPLTIYTAPIRVLLSWVIPFGFAGFYPATLFLGRGEFTAYVYLVPVVTVLFFALAYGFWRLGLNRYQSTGS
jgi:ABC-2 type transport system permease protein